MQKNRTSALWVTLLLSLGLVLASCDDSSDREAKYLDRGKTFFEEDNHIKAQIEFRNALQINPKGTEALYYLALIDEADANIARAYQRYQALVREDPKHVKGLARLGQLNLIGNNLAEAQSQADAIAAIDPKDTGGLVLQAAIHLRQGFLEEAADTSRRALEIAPDDPKASSILAQVHFDREEPDRAFELLFGAAENNPRDVGIRRALAFFLSNYGRTEKAATVHRELVALKPEQLNFRIDFSAFLIQQKRLDEAEEILRDGTAVSPDSEKAALLLSDFIGTYRSLEEAERALGALIEAQPETFVYQFALARVYEKHGQADKSEDTYRRIIAADGLGASGVGAREVLARHYLGSDRRTAAVALIEEVLAEDELNGAMLLLRARVRRDERDFEGAVNDLRTVLRDDPEARQALAELAETHARAGNIELAIDALRSQLEIDPLNATAGARLAWLLTKMGRAQEAQSVIDEASLQSPTNVAVVQARAEFLIAMKDWQNAEVLARALVQHEPSRFSGNLLLGRIFLAQGRHDEAGAVFSDALEERPDSIAALNNLIRSYAAGGQLTTAREFLKQRLLGESDEAVVQNLLGQVQFLQDLPLDTIERAFLQAAALRTDWAQPYANLGRVLAMKGQHDRAIEAFRKGLIRAPEDAALSYDLATTLVNLGDVEGGIATYDAMARRSQGGELVANNLAALIADFEHQDPVRLERAYELSRGFVDSEIPIFLDTLAWVLYRLGKLEEAERLMTAAISKGYATPQANYHIGMIYLGLGKEELAREALTKAVGGAKPDFVGLQQARAALADLEG